MNSPALWIGPAASGKTEFVITQAAARARGLNATPRIVVPTALQARACRGRLAQRGAIGVRVLPMFGLAQAILDEAGSELTLAPDPVQVRLLRGVIDGAPLDYYDPLRHSPGFVELLRGLFAELELAAITADAFSRAILAMTKRPRLTELALLFTAYETRLKDERWVSPAGQVSAAVQALDKHPGLARDWSSVFVDGFDHFAPAQIALLGTLAGRAGELAITLTGDPSNHRAPLVFRRFQETRARLEKALGVTAQPLPDPHVLPPTLRRLESALFGSDVLKPPCGPDLQLAEANDEEGEVRTALQWLKERIVLDGVHPGETALLARDLAPYSDLVASIAAEYGLPVEVWGGLPLAANPAVSDLMALLRLVAPHPHDPAALGFHGLVAAWRSPYFDWPAVVVGDEPKAIDIRPSDANALDIAGRWGRVVGGMAQWEETLSALAAMNPAEGRADVYKLPAGVVTGEAAQAVLAKLQRFTHRLTPPAGRQPVRSFVNWLEELIGPDSEDSRHAAPDQHEDDSGARTSLRIVSRARSGRRGDAFIERDIAALQAFKDVLRGLVWAAETINPAPVNFTGFLADLAGALEAAVYTPLSPGGADRLLVVDIIHARGLPLAAAAVVGLAEGRFPAMLREDPFLRDDDRRTLRETHSLPLAGSLDSAEASFFYETLTRASGQLLLTRPTLAEGGASWPESPYWQEVLRLVDTTHPAAPGKNARHVPVIASWPEVMAALATSDQPALREWVLNQAPERLTRFDLCRRVFERRYRRHTSPHDGDLRTQAGELSVRYGTRRVWSPSRLETYLTCPFQFFVSTVLGLEPRPEPELGLDTAQWGILLHELLKEAYANATTPTDAAEVQAVLERVAPPLLASAPKRLGFRPTAWWPHTQARILDTVRQTIVALAEMGSDWRPRHYEAPFGGSLYPPLILAFDNEELRFRGVIDRVDVNDGGEVRVIDYKSGGAARYDMRALTQGKVLQIPLYALAAEQSLGAGRVVDGFYWSLKDAKISSLRLSEAEDDGLDPAALASEHALAAVQGIRSGQFTPQRPNDGCPPFCPAAAFCWQYRG